MQIIYVFISNCFFHYSRFCIPVNISEQGESEASNEIYKGAQMFKIVNPSFKATAKQSKQCNCVSPNHQDSAAKGTFIETVFTICIFVSSFQFHSVFPPSDVWMLHRQGGPPMGPPTGHTAPPTWPTSLYQCLYRTSPGLIKIKFPK